MRDRGVRQNGDDVHVAVAVNVHDYVCVNFALSRRWSIATHFDERSSHSKRILAAFIRLRRSREAPQQLPFNAKLGGQAARPASFDFDVDREASGMPLLDAGIAGRLPGSVSATKNSRENSRDAFPRTSKSMGSSWIRFLERNRSDVGC
jgi:hypothetical protein